MKRKLSGAETIRKNALIRVREGVKRNNYYYPRHRAAQKVYNEICKMLGSYLWRVGPHKENALDLIEVWLEELK